MKSSPPFGINLEHQIHQLSPDLFQLLRHGRPVYTGSLEGCMREAGVDVVEVKEKEQ